MKDTVEPEKYISPADLARQWGIGSDKVLHRIRTGKLRAVNLATEQHGARPRYRVSPSAIAEFESSRESKPAPISVSRPAYQGPTFV